MPGKERSCKTAGPGAQCTNKKTTGESKGAQQAKRDQKPKKEEWKEQRHVGEQPSVQSRRAEEKSTDEVSKQGQPKRGARGKTCAGRTSPSRATAPDIPEGPVATPLNPRRRATCNGKAESQGELQEPPESIMRPKQRSRKAKAAENPPEEMTKVQPETKPSGGKRKASIEKTSVKQEDHVQETESRNGHIKAAKATEIKAQAAQKTSRGRAVTGDLKEPPEAAAKIKSAEASNEPEETKATNLLLNDTLKTLKIKRVDKSQTSGVINDIIKHIVTHLKKTESFKKVQEPLRTGSYYENLKISSPDEFDVMIPMSVERVEITPFREDGAFYSVALKRGLNYLTKFQQGETLSASQMLSEFRDEVKKCVKPFQRWTVDRKKAGCPAVTLSTTVESVTISLDVVLCLMVGSSWPAFTKDGLNIDRWLGTKVKRDYKFKPFYLVPKYEGKSTAEKDGVFAKDAWRISFSHIEKAILKSHGSQKTCCEKGGVSCCRKDCLKLLKHLLSQLKEGTSSFDKFCSYHAKTTLLHACCSRPLDSEWSASDLSHCFQMLLSDFQAHLRNGKLQNFFIPSQNLLSGPSRHMCNALADRLEKECREGFPIFKKYLSSVQ